jgi:hypothetical protein
MSKDTDANVRFGHAIPPTLPAEVEWFDRNFSYCKTCGQCRALTLSRITQEPKRIVD